MWRADRTEPSSYFLPPACYLVTSQLLLVKLTATKCMPNVTEDVSAGEPGVCLLPRDLIINRSRDTKTALALVGLMSRDRRLLYAVTWLNQQPATWYCKYCPTIGWSGLLSRDTDPVLSLAVRSPAPESRKHHCSRFIIETASCLWSVLLYTGDGLLYRPCLEPFLSFICCCTVRMERQLWYRCLNSTIAVPYFPLSICNVATKVTLSRQNTWWWTIHVHDSCMCMIHSMFCLFNNDINYLLHVPYTF